ncbi:MAG: AAA family ATPase [Candidatus Hydrogenedentes bacterium]|nr:AAA family ATPase [Candidatus Hydrogenedentota bacterium]
MNVKLRKLGPIEQAEFELGDLTVICGSNNTGKTYATYALYGFLDFWEEAYVPPVQEKVLEALYANGKARISLAHYVERARKELDRASTEYSQLLSEVFASREKLFKDSSFEARLASKPAPDSSYEKSTLRSREKDVFYIDHVEPEWLEVALLVEKDSSELIPPKYVLEHRIGAAIKRILYGQLIPRPFIASAERTGAAIFRKELDLARNRALDMLSDKTAKFDPFRLLREYSTDYALPVKRNVDFTRQIGELDKQESALSSRHPDLLRKFSDIIGGTYKVVKDEPYFIPSDKRNVQLTMDESSSSVRSLLDVGFYLRHIARPGELLMIDEPELNLHPENQRRVARLLATLVNHGLKVFITTHSDYIVKEFNTLIMLNHHKDGVHSLMRQEGYAEDELLDPARVRLYISGKHTRAVDGNQRKRNVFTLTQAHIDPELGIEAESFDKTIDDMNRIQDAILYGVESTV